MSLPIQSRNGMLRQKQGDIYLCLGQAPMPTGRPNHGRCKKPSSWHSPDHNILATAQHARFTVVEPYFYTDAWHWQWITQQTDKWRPGRDKTNSIKQQMSKDKHLLARLLQLYTNADRFRPRIENQTQQRKGPCQSTPELSCSDENEEEYVYAWWKHQC